MNLEKINAQLTVVASNSKKILSYLIVSFVATGCSFKDTDKSFLINGWDDPYSGDGPVSSVDISEDFRPY